MSIFAMSQTLRALVSDLLFIACQLPWLDCLCDVAKLQLTAGTYNTSQLACCTTLQPNFAVQKRPSGARNCLAFQCAEINVQCLRSRPYISRHVAAMLRGVTWLNFGHKKICGPLCAQGLALALALEWQLQNYPHKLRSLASGYGIMPNSWAPLVAEWLLQPLA